MQEAIFTPMFVMFGLTLVVWVYMYAKRIPFIQANELTAEQFVPHEFARLQPPSVSNPSDNLKNLFEMPILFYAICLYLFVTNNVTDWLLGLAWGFTVLRIAHSIMHCTANVVIVRFGIYAASSVCLWLMLAIAAIEHLT